MLLLKSAVQTVQTQRPNRVVVLLVLLSAVLLGCDSGPDRFSANSSVAIDLRMPGGQLKKIDRSLFSVQVNIDGTLQTVSPNSDRTIWTGNLLLPEDRTSRLLVEWYYNAMLVSRYSTVVEPITGKTTLEVQSTEYITTGNEFDFDSDGVGNLDELRNGTNPDDPRNIDVVIPRVSADGGPGINGTTGVVWADNQSVDWQGAELRIDNLMIDQGAQRADGQTEFYWQALHDGTSIYFIVYGENVENDTPWGDSTEGVRDDAINLYIDGNNSKLESYDGVDDRHLVIPLLTLRQPADSSMGVTPVVDEFRDLNIDETDYILVESEGNQFRVPAAAQATNIRGNPDWRISRGKTSLPVPEIIYFATGVPDQGQQVYEVKMNIEELGITIGEPFGLDVQIDNDNDGGNRDSRFGWKHPSRGDGPDSNNTGSNPSFMGTAVLQE